MAIHFKTAHHTTPRYTRSHRTLLPLSLLVAAEAAWQRHTCEAKPSVLSMKASSLQSLVLGQGMGQICKKLTFRPASLKSRFHKRLREAVEKRHVKVNRVRSVATVEDPAREKAERERREEARIRATEQLERRQVCTLFPSSLHPHYLLRFLVMVFSELHLLCALYRSLTFLTQGLMHPERLSC